MMRIAKKLSSTVLTLLMVVTGLFSQVPMEVFAAEPATMAHLKSGSGNGNAHFGGASPEAFVLSDKTDITNEDFSFQLKLGSALKDTRFRFVTKYVDDNNWGYIGYDTQGDGGHWFYEFKNDGNSNWPDLEGALPTINQNDVVNIAGKYDADKLTVTVENTTTGEKGTAVADNSNFIGLKNKAGKIGFGAATYGAQYTDIYFTDVKVGDTSLSAEDYAKWNLYRNVEGQVYEPSVTIEEPAKPEEPEQPENPSLETNTWIKLTSGKNNGSGHQYGNANAAAPVLLLDKDKTMAAGESLSLTVKPSNNWGVFYNYVDDNNWLYVGWDTSSKWYYQYNLNGSGGYPHISGLPDPVEGEPLNLSIALNNETLEVTVNGITQRVTNQDLINFTKQTAGKGHFGVKTNGDSSSISFSNVVYNNTNCMKDNWDYAAKRDGQSFETISTVYVSASGKITEEDGKTPIEGAKVLLGTTSTKTDAEGNYKFDRIEASSYSMAVTKPGYQAFTGNVTLSETEENVLNVSLSEKEAIDIKNFDSIKSKSMTAYIGKEFPYVARYEIGDNYFRGNEAGVNTIFINDVEIKPTVTVVSTSESARVYQLDIQDETHKIDFTMKVQISVENNTLEWSVTEIKKADDCAKIASIDLPQLNLLSVDAVEKNANFAGAITSLTTTDSGDRFIDFDNGFEPSKRDGFLYGFLTNENFSAGLFSNSEIEGDKRVIRNNGADTMSLTSAKWYYEAGDAAGQAAAINSKLPDYPTSELPCAKVAIAQDENDDKIIDWNDGALAFRNIMNVPQGSEDIKDLVNYRIVMNFASMASNPYMTTADNIKKVYLATDGLPQAVMLKGYGNEGHDSANSEYADIAEREGGVEDFQDLIKIAHDYNTEVGIHINAQEAYPEAKSFNENMLVKPFGNGWGWLDQSFVINKQWDLATQARWKRLVQLYDRINGTDFYSKKWPEAVGESTGEVTESKEGIKADAANRPDNMDFIYLDVWYQDAWETRQIAKEINSLGWRFSTEFSGQGEYDSTWQHWATDASYGGKTSKGFNSDIIRFIRNDQRDSQVLNYPSYGGTADNPLLGGYRLYGFEGWGGDKDFNNYILQTFNQNLPTKFLQHYNVTKWENYAEGESPVGNHEKEITLKNAEGNTVVVTRNEEQRKDDNIERTITLDGRKVLDDVTYLLPWNDEDGTEKLYHWNLDGGTTTWELPSDWKNNEVILYELSDQGRINEKKLEVTNGSVTIDAKAATAYVLSKGEKVLTLKENFGELTGVVDPGFNGYADGAKLSSDNWSGDIQNAAVQVEKANTGDQRMAFNSPKEDVAVSTTISGLTKGTEYVAEVYVENNSDSKASITVNTGKETVTNYTERSILMNYVKSDQKNGSKMQRMQIPFTAAGETATLTLSREAGEGSAYMDDIRIVEKTLTNNQKDGSFKQDFETVVQGLYPFVLSSAQDINDPVTHLSQLHAPYTDAGWNGRVIDDTIDGDWSLKHHGANNGIIYQTLPQNFRFEAGKTYTVDFDYQSGPDKAYAMVVGNGTEFNGPTEDQYLAQARGDEGQKHVSMTVIGDGSNQTWIGLYEDGNKAGKGSMGQTDFVLDNLVIKENPDALSAAISNTSLYKGETATISGTNLDKMKWSSSDDEIVSIDTETLTIKALSEGKAVITATLPDESTLTFDMEVKDSVVVFVPKEALENAVVSANTEEVKGEPEGSGIKEAAFDNNPDTYWHSKWQEEGFNVSEENPAVLTIDLGTAMTLNGFEIIQRVGGENGLVQKFSYKALAEDGKTVVAQGEHIEVSDNQVKTGAKIFVPFETKARSVDSSVKVQFIEISVEKGFGNFASISEVNPFYYENVADTATIEDTVIKIGESKQVEIKHDKNTLLKGIVWSSSDEAVVTVSKNGTITGIAAGTAVISIDNAAGLHAEAVVIVKENVKTDDLQAQIEKAEAVDLTKYADGVEKDRFTKALAAAKELLENAATQADVDAAVKELAKAQEELILLATDDKEAPSAPTNLTVDAVDDTSVTLSWKASTDNKEVAGYAIYVNDEFIGNMKDTKTKITNLLPSTIYKIEVKAFDHANNYSDAASVEVTTKEAVKDDHDQTTETPTQPDQKPGENKPNDQKPGEGQQASGNSNSKPAIESVDTGDTTALPINALLFLVSGCALAFALKRKKEVKK